MKILGLWDVIQCYWLSSSQHLKGLPCLLLGLLDPKDKSTTELWNVGNYVHNCTAAHPMGFESSNTNLLDRVEEQPRHHSEVVYSSVGGANYQYKNTAHTHMKSLFLVFC